MLSLLRIASCVLVTDAGEGVVPAATELAGEDLPGLAVGQARKLESGFGFRPI